MKKIIACVAAAAIIVSSGAFIVSCDKKTAEADGSCNVHAGVIGSTADAKNTYNCLKNGIIANIDVSVCDKTENLADFDIIYVCDADDEMAPHIEEYVSGGGTAVIYNDAIDKFSYDFLGARELVHIEGCPVDMTYPYQEENVEDISGIIYNYTSLLKDYENFEDYQSFDYGIGIIPSTANLIAEYNGAGVYTCNEYGDGDVFVTNPLLPGKYTVSMLEDASEGEPFASSTYGAGNLLMSYYAEYVSKAKFGFAIERTFGSFGTNPAAWELHYEDITGIENGALETFSKMCMEKGQVPSYTLARNFYTWFKRAESLTYVKYDGKKAKSDYYEGAYCSGTHVVSDGEWLELDSYNNTESYFDDDPQYTKRLYPCPIDWNDDGTVDFICGSADGNFYYYEGRGMSGNYEVGISTCFTDENGDALNVGAYSSPVIFDIDGDGKGELISGSEDGVIRQFEPLKTDDNKFSMAFSYTGDLFETGLVDCMVDAGDLNDDGITDLAIGSREGELRVYYGRSEDGYNIIYGDYILADTGESRIAPCIYQGDLYGGTLEGYIKRFKLGEEGYVPDGYIETDDVSRRGNKRLTIGMNSVPRFVDLNNDGQAEIVCGSLEYGMAYPVDSKYFPCREQLQKQLDFCNKNNIYVGVHGFTNRWASPEFEKRELEMHKKAFSEYGLQWQGNGVNQHTWYTSQYGYKGSEMLPDNSDYDGTFSTQYNAGLLWNSGYTPPASNQVPQSCAENAIPMPAYITEDDYLFMQVCNTPHGDGRYSYVSVGSHMPLLFYNHCDYVYDDADEQRKMIDKVDELVNKYDYTFVGEAQMAKSVAASYNSDILAEQRGDSIIISRYTRNAESELYDPEYTACVGVRVVFADETEAMAYGTDATVHRTSDNAVYVSLDKTVTLNHGGADNDLSIKHINVPAQVKINRDSAEVDFRQGGMMYVRVKGKASTSDKSWTVQDKGGDTVFIKFGKPEKLKIKL